jgi:lysophospholipase L1-like esterase
MLRWTIILILAIAILFSFSFTFRPPVAPSKPNPCLEGSPNPQTVNCVERFPQNSLEGCVGRFPQENVGFLSNVRDELLEKYGDSILDLSIAHKGSSSRVKDKILQASNGKPIKFGVIGGSISTGHTLQDSKETYHSLVFDWWNKKFRVNNTIVNGAVPATSSSYFTYCYDKHIPNDLDIIFIEFSINDGSIYPTERGNGDPMITKNMELLVRNLLQMPTQPAIIFVSFFSFKVDYYFNGQEAHLSIANYYDIPYISFKNVFFNHLIRFPTQAELLFSSDFHHPNKEGHKVMSEFIIHYFDQIGIGQKSGNYLQISNDIPVIDMWSTRKTQKDFRELQPTCQTFNPHRPGGGYQNYRPYDMNEWYFLDWKKEKFYIAADKPGANITFSIETNKGSVYMYVLKSDQYNLGNVWCWPDNDYNKGKELVGYWNISRSIGKMMLVSEGLTKGKHYVHCKLLEKSDSPNNGTHFRILAIFSG